ncbi:MAG: phosphate ABC transporter permease PstA [Planctomycetota bacterium]
MTTPPGNTPLSTDGAEAAAAAAAGLRRRKRVSSAFAWLCFAATAACLVILAVLLGAIFYQGVPWLSWTLLTNNASEAPEDAGIKAALVGSLWLIAITGAIAVPIGVGAAVYLEEYAPSSWWRRLIQLNIANLAGVPSIVYGILGLGLFVRTMGLGKSVLAGALTLALVVLPIVILATQEALRAVPGSIRQASFALGATRWQTIWRQVLPAATPGIMTGVILAISRALGEAAPLVAVGAAIDMTFLPATLGDAYSGMPLLIFYWAGHSNPQFHQLAGAAIVVLLLVLILLNSGAVLLRYRYSRRINW